MIDENLEKSLSLVDALLGRCHDIAKRRFGDVSPELVMKIYDRVREQEEYFIDEQAYQLSLKN